MSNVLSIAGFDPSSGAGITADLAVFAAHGIFGVSAITALTVQSTVGVRSVHPVNGGLLFGMLEELESDLPPCGIKIGMLGTGENVTAVTEFIEGLRHRGRRPVIVLDPVLRSSSGRALLDEGAIDLLRRRLLPLVDWVTPNLDEFAVLLGLPQGLGVTPGRTQIIATAHDFQREWAAVGLVVTGGHMDPPDDLLMIPMEKNVDSGNAEIGLSGSEFWLAGERVTTTATHGTGCAFSSAFLCGLVLGHDPLRAATEAKHYVRDAMRLAVPRGHGRGPMNLLWPLQRDPMKT